MKSDGGPSLERGLSAMASEYREVMILIDIEDYAYADAASTLGVPIGTVRSRLFRPRRFLQEALMENARDGNGPRHRQVAAAAVRLSISGSSRRNRR